MKILTITPQLPVAAQFTAILTSVDNEKKTVSFVHDDKSYEGTYEGDAVQTPLLSSILISSTGEITLPVRAKEKAKADAPVSCGCDFQKRF